MICVDCRSVWAGPSGVLGYQRTLARKLPALAPKRHFQLLLPSAEQTELQTEPNVHAVYAPADAAGALAPLSMQRGMDVRGLSLVHATGGLFPNVNVPVVTTIHDTLWITEPKRVCPPGLLGSVLSRVYRRVLLRALEMSARIIVPSQTTRDAIAEIAPSAIDRVRVVPNGVGDDFVPLNQADPAALQRVSRARDRFVPGARRYVLEVGRPVDHRNHMGLLRAFAGAFRADSRTHLVFVQPVGSRTRALARLASELSIEGRVHIISGLSNVDLCSLYQGALCLCHPTSYESYPTPIAEAMACGCPVITSGRAAAGEIAGDAAQLINPEREDEIECALRRVAGSAGVAERLQARGLERAKLFSAADMARATWAVYQEALA